MNKFDSGAERVRYAREMKAKAEMERLRESQISKVTAADIMRKHTAKFVALRLPQEKFADYETEYKTGLFKAKQIKHWKIKGVGWRVAAWSRETERSSYPMAAFATVSGKLLSAELIPYEEPPHGFTAARNVHEIKPFDVPPKVYIDSSNILLEDLLNSYIENGVAGPDDIYNLR